MLKLSRFPMAVCLLFWAMAFFGPALNARAAASASPSPITIACMLDNEPLSFISKTGEPAGMMVELWRLWGEKVGRPVKFFMDMERLGFNLEEVLLALSNIDTSKSGDRNIELLLHLDKDVPVFLMGDPLRLGQVLTNLVSNAVKFTPAGEVVVGVTLQSLVSNKATLRFSVSDTGIGMAVMEEGSISHAAKTLHRVPSGVTARILQMEADLGVQLFLREKKRLLPTAKGQTLYDYARRVLALLDEAENSVRGMPSEARRVTFSASFFSVSTLER
jgi:Transcriptional regulator